MSKPKRNHPCPCGSGIKYKKCCMKKELEMEAEKTIITPHSLKEENRELIGPNMPDNRDKAAETSEAEMLRRDQFVTMRQLQVQRGMMAKDAAFNKAAIKDYNDFLDELRSLPISEARAAVSAMVEKQVDILAKQVEQSNFSRPNEITLAALEAALDENEAFAAGEPVESDDDDPEYDDDGPEELKDD